MPSAVPWTRSAPELERVDRVHDGEAAVVVAVPVDADLGAGAFDEVAGPPMRLRTPSGVAWPTVSQRQSRSRAVVDGVQEQGASVSGWSAWCLR
jgi:hypothetical protein